MKNIHVRKTNNETLQMTNGHSFGVRNVSFIATSLLLTVCLAFTSQSVSAKKRLPRLLVFSKTAGFRHDCIPVAKLAMIKLGQENGFAVDTTEDAAAFSTRNLKRYAAVLFLNTTGDVLNDEQQTAMQNYIHNGGGYMGIHAATDTEYGWPWYNKLAGAWFTSHPKQQDATLIVVDRNNPSTSHLQEKWQRWDEWYNFKDLNPDVHVLIKIDESSYEGGKNGDNHPMAWYHDFEGGRSFYTELGHTKESYADQAYLQHVLGGLRYAMNIKAKK
ncbi:ThuA domain-containing protein [Chitinophaga agri]|uniref:ThuA domain-containing protein n=1 Tax=Chitinophaga agri TaxID=2703787 RepID=A0A6B9ZHM4_9BACT|nr:ThuA domain-containing protein [Chitinophaga agri]QHS60991.1 ThuA domain-containing protein [Chitinophaga agri]